MLLEISGEITPEKNEGMDLLYKNSLNISPQDFPGGPVVKNLPASAGDMGLIPGSERFHMPWSN